MHDFTIFGDTSQDLTYELGEEFGVEVIPYTLQMGEEHFRDLDEISSRKFYEIMENYEVLSTGTPPIQDVIDRIDQAKAQGSKGVLLMTASEKLTGMATLYGAIKSQYEGIEMYIYDTGFIGAASGILTLYAGRLKKEGKSLEEIIKELDRVKEKTSLHALFRTLKYLVKGGRFNKYKGMIGTLLNINPLLEVKDGEIHVKTKIRGTKSSLSALAKTIREEVGEAKDFHLIIFSGNNEEEVAELKEKLGDLIERAQFFLETEFTPVLGVHAGPKSIGVATLTID